MPCVNLSVAQLNICFSDKVSNLFLFFVCFSREEIQQKKTLLIFTMKWMELLRVLKSGPWKKPVDKYWLDTCFYSKAIKSISSVGLRREENLQVLDVSRCNQQMFLIFFFILCPLRECLMEHQWKIILICCYVINPQIFEHVQTEINNYCCAYYHFCFNLRNHSRRVKVNLRKK